MTAPAERPAAARLTDANLAAEVERLRAILAAMVEKVPVAYDYMDAEECAYCGGDMDGFARKWGRTPVPMHAPDCPWLLARAALAPPEEAGR